MDTSTEGAAEGVVETTPDTAPVEPSTETFERLAPDTLVTIKVNGTEQEIPLGEALKGYQRQADYTRKSQEVAQLRSEAEDALQIQRALRANPAATLQALARHHGIEIGGDTDEYVDPADARVRELEQTVGGLQSQLRQQSVDREVNELVSRYGDDVDVEAVMRHALNSGFPTLRAAYADLVIDDALPAYKQAARRAAEDEVVIGLKRQAAVVAPGSSSGAEAPTGMLPRGTRPANVRESYELAKAGKAVPRWSPDDWK